MGIKTATFNFKVEYKTLEGLHDGIADCMLFLADQQDIVSSEIEKQNREKQFQDYLRGPFKF